MNITIQNVTMNYPNINIEVLYQEGTTSIVKTLIFGGQSQSEIEDAIKQDAELFYQIINNSQSITIIDQYNGNSFLSKQYVYDGINLIRS